jgi:hypothetical protein
MPRTRLSADGDRLANNLVNIIRRETFTSTQSRSI